MGHKVDLAEVIAFSDKVTTASNEIDIDINAVKDDISKIDNMDSFSGYAASNAKKYLNDLHVTLLDSFHVLYTVLNENLLDHIDTFKSSVDSSDAAIVQSDYLEQIRIKIDIEYQNLTGNESSIRSTLESISDIIYITAPSLQNVTSGYEAAIQTIDELDNNLNTFTTKGKNHDSDTKELLQNIKVVMNKANASSGEARFKEYKFGSEGSSVAALRQTVKYISKGTNLIEAHIDDKVAQRQNQRPNQPKNPGIKADGGKESIWSKAKSVGSKFTKGVKDSFKSMGGFKPGIPNRILGPAGGLLSYNSNYQNALAHDKKGVDAHVYAAEDTALDIAIGAGVAVAAATAVAVAAPLIGAGALAATLTVGVTIVGGIFVNMKLGKENESIADRIKGGYRKIKGWFS